MDKIQIDNTSLLGVFENIESAFKSISKEIDRLSLEIGRFREACRPKDEAPRVRSQDDVASWGAIRSGSRPACVQEDLPLVVAHRPTYGDAGYADEANPVRQAVGQIGGLANDGVARAPSPDRRPKGSVMVKLMGVNEKRRYWRWADDRKRARRAGATPPSWNDWTAAGDRLVLAD